MSQLGPPPELVEDALMEILLRVPPDDPAQILRASLVSKRWSRILSSPGFRRRLHELHGTPPLLGFFHKMSSERDAVFVPTTTSSAFSLPIPSSIHGGWALDYRHGRALFLPKRRLGLLVWDPSTGDQRRVPWPAKFSGGGGFSASVLCAAQDQCDHRACHGGPFLVALVFNSNAPKPLTSACVYSSETRLWSELTSVDQCAITCNSVLVGNSLLYFQCLRGRILEYDLAMTRLAVLMGTPDYRCEERETAVLQAQGGGLGVALLRGSCLQLWSRDLGDGGWVQSRVIDLTNMLPDAVFETWRPNRVIAFAEELNAVFLGTVCGVFAIELQSTRVRKVSNDRSFYKAIPVISFYTPAGKGANRMVYGSGESSPAEPKPKRTKSASLQVPSTSAEVPQEQLVTTPTSIVTASQVEMEDNRTLTRSRKKQLELATADATSPSTCTSNAVKNADGLQQVTKRSKVTRAKKK